MEKKQEGSSCTWNSVSVASTTSSLLPYTLRLVAILLSITFITAHHSRRQGRVCVACEWVCGLGGLGRGTGKLTTMRWAALVEALMGQAEGYLVVVCVQAFDGTGLTRVTHRSALVPSA